MYKASQTLRTLEFLISKVWSVHELGKNFQRRGRMRGEQSLTEREMILEKWAAQRKVDSFQRLLANFYSLKTKFLQEQWHQVIGQDAIGWVFYLIQDQRVGWGKSGGLVTVAMGFGQFQTIFSCDFGKGFHICGFGVGLNNDLSAQILVTFLSFFFN